MLFTRENPESTVAPEVANSRNVAADAIGAIAEGAIEGARKERKKYTKKNAGAAPTTDAEKQAAELSDALKKMFDPANWRAIVRAPADLRLAVTGRAHWNLTEQEVDNLASTGSTCAQYFLHTDPKYLALTLFLFNAAVAYGSRIALDLKMDREEKKKAGK